MSPATERRRRLQVLEFQSNLPAVPDYGPRVQISNHGFHQNPMNATLPPLMPDYCRIPNSVLSPQRERMNALARTYRQPESLPPSLGGTLAKEQDRWWWVDPARRPKV